MRRSVDVHAAAGRFEHGAQIGDDRALAVGAGNMHHRWQLLLGVANQFEQTLDPRELEIDDLRMEPHDALQHNVAGGSHALHTRCLVRSPRSPPVTPAKRSASRGPFVRRSCDCGVDPGSRRCAAVRDDGWVNRAIAAERSSWMIGPSPTMTKEWDKGAIPTQPLVSAAS